MASETTIAHAIKSLLKWIVAASIAVVLLATLIAIGVYGFYAIKDRPQKVTELKGVVLGEKIGDVMFKNHGYKIEQPEKNQNGSFPEAGIVTYSNKDARILFTIKNDKVESVDYSCSQDYEYTSVSEVACGDSSEKIKKRFGDKIRVLCHMDKEVRNQLRAYDAVEYGVRFQLYYNRVVGFAIFSPNQLSGLVGINWSECD